MTSVFFKILEISITAAFASLIVLITRFFLKGAPRWLTCLLWALVALRLLCPILPESEVSFVPDVSSEESFVSGYTTSDYMVKSETDYYFNNAGYIPNKNSDTSESYEESTINNLSVIDICSLVWFGGTMAMLLYGAFSYVRMKLRFSDAVLLKDNIRQSEKVASPFVMGVVKPYIYVPFSLDRKTRKQVVMHEQAHIKRLDHIWKPLGFLLLCVHWFNPFVWLSYVLFCRDVEVACDEKVIKDYKINQKKNYAMALLKCRVSPRVFSVNPLGFGELGVGARIKKTLRYRKPAQIIAVFSLVLILVLSLCLLTNPISAAGTAQIRKYYDDRVTAGYALETQEPETEPEEVTEPATEAYEQETEDYYYYNTDATNDEYSITWRELEMEPYIPEPLVNSNNYSVTSVANNSVVNNSLNRNNLMNQDKIYIFYEPNKFPWNNRILG